MASEQTEDKVDPEEAYWQEDAERLNRLAEIANEMGVVAAVPDAKVELDEEGVEVATPPETPAKKKFTPQLPPSRLSKRR